MAQEHDFVFCATFEIGMSNQDIGNAAGILGGLHAAVLGKDLLRARRVASQLQAGRVVINGMTDDPQAPWGGFKYSGVGREYGQYGIGAFLEPKAMLES